jgi:TPR repeat protein
MRMFFTLYCLWGILLCSIAQISADTNTGIDLFWKKKYVEAVPYLQKGAKGGDLPALDFLGYMYEFGMGVKQDYVIAMNLYKKGEVHNYAPVLYNMGRMYLEGKGVPKNREKAIEYYEKSAKENSLIACQTLGDVYFSLQPVDMTKAFYWYQQWLTNASSENIRNDNYIVYFLAEHLKTGDCMPKDLNTALKYASIGKKTKAKVKAVQLYDSIIQELYPTLDSSRAYSLGINYWEENQYEKSIPLFNKAAESGNIKAMKKLADIYYLGECNMPRNSSIAITWYKKLAEMDDVQACCSLGNIYKESARGQAKKYFLKAAQQNNVYAQEQLGEIYSTEGNDAEAILWLEKASNKGSGYASYRLGHIYVKQSDYRKARDWLQKSARAGYSSALDYLKFMDKQNYW